ncbi:helix-turn-helix domain-containing protein [Nocardioides sp.]|uniref:helix-turn-helix domain-containing protein n=1 Tax=Nocardioides sp. TaxID=35761 RepID=UPI0039E634E7
MDPATLIGARIRTTRRDRGLSLAALAKAAGVGKGSLSEVENGVRNPTLGTLYALAGALGVPLAVLLAERAGTQVASPGISARLLETQSVDDAVVEVYLLHLDAGARHDSPGHGDGVVETMTLTQGRASIGPTGRETEAAAGETVTWTSDGRHGYRALGEGAVEAVLVIRSPRDRAG